jgi:hypothetical protein
LNPKKLRRIANEREFSAVPCWHDACCTEAARNGAELTGTAG